MFTEIRESLSYSIELWMNTSPLSNICQEMKEGKRSTTDLVWSLKIFNIDRTLVNKNEPVLYHLKDGPKRGFVGEELQIGPPGIELPSEEIR